MNATIHPALSECLPQVYNILRILPPPTSNELGLHYEIEARFGTFSHHKGGTGSASSFTPGVDLAFFEECLHKVNTWKEWSLIKPIEQLHDCFYEIPPHADDLLGKPILVRTSVQFNKSALQLSKTHISKSKMHELDLKYTPHNSMSILSPQCRDIRLGINEERTINDSLPSRTVTKFVRIKDRTSYLHTPVHCQVPVWSIDFTRSWSGNTRSEAEIKQKSEAPIYEIEVECLNPYAYMNLPQRNIEYLGLSLMMKMLDFVGPNSATHFFWKPL